MEAVNPRDILEHCFDILNLLPDNSISIELYTGQEEITTKIGDIYYIHKENDKYRVVFEGDREPMLLTKDEFKFIIKKELITIISLRNPNGAQFNRSIVLFRCENPNCSEFKNWATKTIQSNFKKSRGYTEWQWSPSRLNEQGVFGKNADQKGIYRISPFDKPPSPENIDIRSQFGKKTKGVSRLNQDINYLLKRC